MWVCTDGREVLHNRNYRPIWQRQGGVVTLANPREWPGDTKANCHFYMDGLFKKEERRRRVERVLEDFKAGRDVWCHRLTEEDRRR